ncbi:MAG: hypothetical protein ACR2NY_05605 [Alphaproteobacteria bacterium]
MSQIKFYKLCAGFFLLCGLMAGNWLGNVAMAQNKKSKTFKTIINVNLLRDAIDGKLIIKGEGGWLYNFAGKWSGDGDTDNNVASLTETEANALNFAFGGSFGYEHTSGLGISVDYFGFSQKWTTEDMENMENDNFTASTHIISLTPSYRLGFGITEYWGMKIGLGIGMSLSNLQVENNDNQSFDYQGDIGVLLLPSLAMEYDNGVMHIDINSKYIYSFVDVNYGADKNFIDESGQVGIYVGSSLGLNF